MKKVLQSKPQIGLRQFNILVILYTVGTTILITPAGLASTMKQDAWMIPILALAPGLVLVWLFNKVSRQTPNATLVEICESVLGPWTGAVVSILFALFSFLAAAMVLFDVGRFVITAFMPETPMIFVNSLFALLLAYAMTSGIDTFARMIELLFPVFCILLLIMILFISPQMEFHKIQHIGEAGPKQFFSATLSILSIAYMPLIVFLMVKPYVKDSDAVSRSFIKSTFIGGVISVLIVASTILVLGADITSLKEYPVYYLAQSISIGNFLERIEAIEAAMWLITAFVKLTLYFYASLAGFTTIAKLSSQRSILLPMTLLLLIFSIDIFPNSVYEHIFNTSDWIVLVFGVSVVIPLILIIVQYGRALLNRKVR